MEDHERLRPCEQLHASASISAANGSATASTAGALVAEAAARQALVTLAPVKGRSRRFEGPAQLNIELPKPAAYQKFPLTMKRVRLPSHEESRNGALGKLQKARELSPRLIGC